MASIVVPKPSNNLEKAPNIPAIFKPDFLTNLITNGKRIYIGKQDNVPSTTLYTVPKGYKFFLISVSLHTEAVAATSAGSVIYSTENPSTTNCLINQKSNNVINDIRTRELSFSIPLIFFENQSLVGVSGSTNLICNYQLTGYEILSSLI
jgi:hypothetical protein